MGFGRVMPCLLVLSQRRILLRRIVIMCIDSRCLMVKLKGSKLRSNTESCRRKSATSLVSWTFSLSSSMRSS